MVKIENTNGGFTLTGIMKGDTETCEMIQYFCSQAKIEYIGRRITKDRDCVILVRYHNKLYYNLSWCSYDSEYTLLFHEFSRRIDETEPFENYQYYISYCNPRIDDETVLYFYYKADELEKAKKMQKKLGENLAFITEIKSK